MNRREVLALLGVTAALPASVLAQTNATRRLGVLSVTAADDAIGQTRSAVLVEALAGHGWKEHDSLKIHWRNGGGDRARIAQFADELVALKPDTCLRSARPRSRSCAGARRRSRSFSPSSQILSARALSRISPIPAAISPASPITTARWPANGWRC